MEDPDDRTETSEWLPSEADPAAHHDDIVRRRKDLRDAMMRLEASVARSRRLPDWHQVVDDALAGVEDALRRHTTEVEAKGGLLTDIVTRAPRLAAAAESLRAEHRQLEEDIWAVRAVAGTHGVDPSQVRAEVLGLVSRLAMHRQTGADLLYDAYSVDLGGDHD